MQKAVSGNKRRFIDKESDLDLTYIADRLVAMALPCVAGAAYRNDIREVSRFFTSRHYGAFKVFNLCEGFEESGNGNYDTSLFYNQVIKVPQRDHNICTLQTLVNTMKQATAFLNLDKSNVVAIHCRGGKGRTGSFCASLLLWVGFSRTAAHALATFAHRRTDLSLRSLQGSGALQGVASPSQIRYVHYVEAVRYLHFDFVAPRTILINRIEVEGVPLEGQGGTHVTFVVETASGIIYDHGKSFGLRRCAPPNEDFAFHLGNIPVTGDVAIRFFSFNTEDPRLVIGCMPRMTPGGRGMEYTPSMSSDVIASGRQIFFVQFHTSFHKDPVLHFSRREIDGAYNAKASRFPANFSLRVEVTDLPLLIASKAAAKVEQELSIMIQGQGGDKGRCPFTANAVRNTVLRQSSGIQHSRVRRAHAWLRASSGASHQGTEQKGSRTGSERPHSGGQSFAGSSHSLGGVSQAGRSQNGRTIRSGSDNDLLRTATIAAGEGFRRERRLSMHDAGERGRGLQRTSSASTSNSKGNHGDADDAAPRVKQNWDTELQTVPGKAWVSTLERPESVTSALPDGEAGFMGRSTMWSGRRLLQLHTLQHFEMLMLQAGAEEMQFSKGEAVRRFEGNHPDRCLILIREGICAVFPSSRAELADMPYYNPGAQRGSILRGVGEFCCIREFFLGSGGEDTTSHVLAASDVVRCLVIRLDDNKQQPPLFGHMMPHSDVNKLYEALARTVTERTTSADLLVSNFNTKLVKHDDTASTEESTRAQMLNRLRSKFSIPISQKCHHICHCMLKVGGNMDNTRGAAFFAALGRSGGCECRLFVFSDAIFLVSQYQDVYLLIADIESVTVKGRTLDVRMREAETSPQPSTVFEDTVANSPARRSWNQIRDHVAAGIHLESNGGGAKDKEIASYWARSGRPDMSPALASLPVGNLSGLSSWRQSSGGATVESRAVFSSVGHSPTRENRSTPGRVGQSRRGSMDRLVLDGSFGSIREGQERDPTELSGRLDQSGPFAPKRADLHRCTENTRCEMLTSDGAIEARNLIRKEIKRRSPWLADPTDDKDFEDDEQRGSGSHSNSPNTTREANFGVSRGLKPAQWLRVPSMGRPHLPFAKQETPASHEPIEPMPSEAGSMNNLQEDPSMSNMFLEDPEIIRDFGLKELLASLPLSRRRSGECISPAGSQIRSVYFIVDGSALCRDRDVILVRRFRGEVLGEVSFYRLGNRGAGCDVIAGPLGCVMREIPAHLMDTWRVHEPLKAARINRFIARSMALRMARQFNEGVIFDDTS